jgi:hypothetical protein
MASEEITFEQVWWRMVAARLEFMCQLAKFRADELERPPQNGGSSPLQVVMQVYMTDGLILEQLRSVQEEDNPSISRMISPLPTSVAEPFVTLEKLLTDMATRRTTIFQYLASLSEAGWKHSLHHKAWGVLDFCQLASLLALYDQQHTQQLVALQEVLDK